MKIFKKSILLVFILFVVVAFTGCGKEEDKENELEVFIWDSGYGTQWIDEELKAFINSSWVKEKYPNGTYKLKFNDQQGFALGRLNAGESNSIDVFFAPDLRGGYNNSLELTELLYESMVPNEDVKFKDKMENYALESGLYYEDTDSEGKYYSLQYGAGMVGFMYNVTIFESLGLEVPNTTDELVALCETVKQMDGRNPDYPYTYTFKSSKVAYSDRLQNLFWQQYDGIDGVKNYFSAISADGTRNSQDIFNELGRLKSMEVFESIYKKGLGYYDRSSFQDDFMQGQTKFLSGDGLIMVCGEWFSYEMHELAIGYRERGFDYEIGMMKYPIVSSIIDKTPSIKNDEMLSKVIDDIDAGLSKATDTTVTQADFDLVKKARRVVVCPDAVGSNAVISKYTKVPEMAVDFFRFLATDEANEIYAEYTCGGMLPFKFNLKKDAPELHQKLLNEQKNTYRIQSDVSDILHEDGVQILSGFFPLTQYGGFSAWLSKYANWEYQFMSDENLSARDIFDESNAYWLDNDGARFKSALSRAGML